MQDFRDKWSSEEYLRFRPEYPEALIRFIGNLKEPDSVVWDCGTGNGQLASGLSSYYNLIYATDISNVQLKNAIEKSNIKYSVSAAEHSCFSPNTFDLITVAQAIHWFDFDAFFKEAKRVSKPDALLCITGYGNIQTFDDSMPLIQELYSQTLKGYWDTQRKFIDEEYKNIPFPFAEIAVPEFEMCFDWSLEQLCGYIGTWSGLIRYAKDKGENPLKKFYSALTTQFSPEHKVRVRFPILFRVGKIN